MDHERLTRSVVRNHGILLPALLDDLGVTPRQRQRRVATGEWRRLPGGVLTVAAVPITFDMQVHAALVAIPAAVLSHQTSARVLEMGVSDHRIHLSVERGGRTRLPGVVIHQVDLPRCDVTVRRGLRVTTRERTLVDLAAVIGVDELQRCVDDQLVAGRTTLPRLHATFGRLGGQGRPGTARMRAVLEQLDREPPTESELEAMFRRLLDDGGLTQPIRQMNFSWMEAERGRVDCWYPGHDLIVELDGRRTHARVAAFDPDRRRDLVAAMNGFRTVRITYEQVADDPRFVIDAMTALLHNER